LRVAGVGRQYSVGRELVFRAFDIDGWTSFVSFVIFLLAFAGEGARATLVIQDGNFGKPLLSSL
jgi:hypothetical protein